ncbi:MAG TPA: radical SAM protein, partial [Spirochaetia bacterium]|nr:radical SAM protein [Spirochaetia bacterium]
RAQGKTVVYGGPHASFLPEEALEHGDYVIVGEGETGFPLLAEALNRNASLLDVPGLVWKDNGVVRRNPPAQPIEDLDSLPFPDFSLLDMGSLTKMGIQGPGKPTIPMQTSRGCPFDCTFCSVTGMFGRRYRHRSTENIIAELSQYDPSQHVIFFYDDNFAANPRKTKELLREMIRCKLGFEWSTQVRSDIAKDREMLDLMVQAGCTSLYIGFESVDPRALQEMKKSQSVEDIRFAIREIRKRKIHVHGMFVFGFDSDTPDSAKATVDFAIAEKIDSTQFMILTPLPGSGFYARMLAEGRLLDTDWDTFDAHHVKFVPRGFTPWELQRAQIDAHTRFYALLRVIARLLRGRIAGFLVGVYAHALNRRWQRVERDYLSWLRRLRLAAAPA